jgi:hypothetical protein
MNKKHSENEEEPKKDSLWKKHKTKIKIAAGVVGTAVALGTAHYVGKKFSPRYAEYIKNVKLPSFRRKNKEAGKDPANNPSQKDLRQQEDELIESQRKQLKERLEANKDDKTAEMGLKELGEQKIRIFQQRRDDDKREREKKEEELKNRKGVLDKVLGATQEFSRLQNDQLLGPLITKIFTDIGPMLQQIGKENDEELGSAEKEVESAQEQLGSSNDSEKQQKFEQAQERLKQAKIKANEYDVLVNKISKLQEELDSKKTSRKKKIFLKEMNSLSNKLEKLKKSREAITEFGRKRFKKTPKKGLNRLKKDLKRLNGC